MECVNHPATPTDRTCYECGKPFCPACYSKVDRRFCLSCYHLLYTKMKCEAAEEALVFALLGIFCFGVILEPLALILALQAKREIRANPKLSGWGKANTAYWIAVLNIGLCLSLLIIYLLNR